MLGLRKGNYGSHTQNTHTHFSQVKIVGKDQSLKTEAGNFFVWQNKKRLVIKTLVI